MSQVISFIDRVISFTACTKHDAVIGDPCWVLQSSVGSKVGLAICDSRARQAGYIGKSEPTPLTSKEKALRGSWSSSHKRTTSSVK